MGIREEIVELKEKEKQIIERAYAQTPTEYHQFIVLLKQNTKVANFAIQVTDELKGLGAWTRENATYVSQQLPYMTVDGRVKMAVDEAVKENETVEIGVPQITELAGKPLCHVTVKTARGLSTGTSKIGIGGKGVDRDNPFENAQTSAIGRALAFLGYGIIGTGIASADEMRALLSQDNEAKKTQETESQKAKPTNKTKKEKTETPVQQKPQSAKSQEQKNKIEDSKQKHPNGSLGVFSFAVKGIKEENVGGQNVWVIAGERLGTNKVSTLHVDPTLNFNGHEISEGEILDITLTARGKYFIASEIKPHKAVS